MDRTPVIYVARLPSAVTRVGSMPLERLVLRSGDRLLRPLPRHDESALAEKTILVADRGGHDVDLQVGGAPPHGQVRGDLRELPSRPFRPLPTGGSDAIRRLEDDRRRRRLSAIQDRKSVVWGKRVSVGVDRGGR